MTNSTLSPNASPVRTALVTGAATGIGRAIAAALFHADYNVVLADIDVEQGRAAAEQLLGSKASSQGAAACAFTPLDVRQRSAFDAAVDFATQRFGAVDVLVNNAALTRSRPFEEIDEAEWNDVIAVNLRSVLFGCQSVAPGMRARRWGRVINLTSAAGQRGGPAVQGVHYAASKAGIIGATRYFAHELGAAGITVNAIAPGPILTEQTQHAPPEKLAAVSAQLPVGRLGDVREVGAMAVYLSSKDAGFVTGATFDINGGLIMR